MASGGGAMSFLARFSTSAHGVHYQARFDAAEIHDDDARAIVGRFDLQTEALPRVQYRNYFAAAGW